MKIEITMSPNQGDIDYITNMINQETLEYGEAKPFAFYIRDELEKIIAGANGYIIFGEIYTDQLWIKKEYRCKGLARKLMERVHSLGKAEGCKIAAIKTMSFQCAVGFYEKIGYEKDFERNGYVRGSSCLFFKKDLEP